METLASLGHGFAVALTPFNLFWSALGVTIGTAIGVLPGIGPALTVALLLPVTNPGGPAGPAHPVNVGAIATTFGPNFSPKALSVQTWAG